MINWREWLDAAHISEAELASMLARPKYVKQRTFTPVQSSSAISFEVPIAFRWQFVCLYVQGTNAAGSGIGFEVINDQGVTIYARGTPTTANSKSVRLMHNISGYAVTEFGTVENYDVPFPFEYLDGGWILRVTPVGGGSIACDLTVRELYNV